MGGDWPVFEGMMAKGGRESGAPSGAGEGAAPIGAPVLVVTAVLWFCSYAVATGRSFTMPVEHGFDMSVRRAILHLLAFGLTVLMELALRRMERRDLRVRAAAAFGLSIVGSAAYGALNVAIFYAIWPRWGSLANVKEGLIDVVEAGTMVFWVFLLCAACYFAMTYREALQRQALTLARTEALALDAQNRMLRYQINPHFLFNALNALSALVLDRDNARAEHVLQSLSQFLRRSLYTDPSTMVPLADELEAEAEYLSVEKIRFAERLAFVDRTSAAAKAVLVPNLILQPILENAVKHGVAKTSDRVTVTVTAEVEEGRLHLSVVDDAHGPPPTAGGQGIGLINVRRRLDLVYDGRASIEWGPGPGGGFAVSIEAPAALA